MSSPLELVTPDEMAAVDAAAIASGLGGAALMENAGAAVAARAMASWPDAVAVLVLAGPGNNGGDGFVAARLLAAEGRLVTVALLGDRSALKGDAAQAAARWRGPVTRSCEADPASADLLIDALFGAGLSRRLEGEAARLVDAVNASARPVLAVDVPSGLDGATGAAIGPVVRASATVTFVRLKPGHVLTPGRGLCGPVHLADIGVPDAVVASVGAKAFLNRPALWLHALPQPSIEGHKYSRGHVAVWSGPELQTGASRLSATAALRAGAGAVTLVGDHAALAVHAAHVTSVMLREADPDDGWGAFLSERRVAAAVVGPGAGANPVTRRAVEQALRAAPRAVFDADVFSLFSGDVDTLARLIADAGAEVVLTPHEGEFRRLFGEPAGSKLERVRAAAAQVGAVVLLKGPDTVVAAPDGRASIADNAPPDLATAGAGDVLAGIVAGLLAQGAPAFEAASAGVWIHGEAGRAVGRGLIADDLPGAIPSVLQRLEQMPS